MKPFGDFYFLVNFFEAMRAASDIIQNLIACLCNLSRYNRISIMGYQWLELDGMILGYIQIIWLVRRCKFFNACQGKVSHTDQLVAQAQSCHEWKCHLILYQILMQFDKLLVLSYQVVFIQQFVIFNAYILTNKFIEIYLTYPFNSFELLLTSSASFK